MHGKGVEHLVEGEGFGSWRGQCEHRFGGGLLTLGGSDPGGDDLGRDTRLQAVQMLGELAFALDERGPGSHDCRVLAMSLGIGLYDLPGGGLDALRCEHPGEPGVHMREQSVLAHRQARRVVVHRHWVVAASVTAVEGMSAGRVALELLLAAVTDHQTVHWRTELRPRAGVGCTWSKVHGGRHAILVAWRRLPMDAR